MSISTYLHCECDGTILSFDHAWKIPVSILSFGFSSNYLIWTHCRYSQWKCNLKTVFCIRLQLFNCIWIAVQSMQKLVTKVVKITFYCNPNIAGGLMLKSFSKLWSLNSFYFIFSSKKSAKLTGKSSINYKYFMYRKNKNF